ncbi:MAG: hypothetical protein HY259_11735 [Chloroflexi bacterium]|nr:hypothetical protein [Chloroflexota bacterium]
MSKKTLDENTILNELKGGSLFFKPPEHAVATDPPSIAPAAAPVRPLERAGPLTGDDAATTYDAVSPEPTPDAQSAEAIPLASSPVSTLASYPAGLINEIRKTVKTVGKEVSFVRLTSPEKHRLMDIVYSYKRQGIRTSENEINRIAVNFLLEDYQANGGASVLARVIEALLA